MDQLKPKILIVDDERFFINILVDLLKADYRTLIAVNGEQAIERTLSASPPDLIILDIVMPGMDGYEVCRRLKINEKSRDIPIIFLTTRSEVGDETKGFQLGAIDYITKPISPPIVKARVNTHLTLEHTREKLKHYDRQLEETLTERSHIPNQSRVEGKRTEEQLYRSASYDPVTAFPNRFLFKEQVLQAMKYAKRIDIALLVINFCEFLPTGGLSEPQGNDEFMRESALRLSQCIHDTDLIARLDADSFAIALLSIREKSEIDTVRKNIATTLNKPYQAESGQFSANFRIGRVPFPEDGAQLDTLVNRTKTDSYPTNPTLLTD